MRMMRITRGVLWGACALAVLLPPAVRGTTEDAEALAGVWYRVADCEACPTAIYLHGGPGYNAWSFEKMVGRALDKRIRMVYFDQRGAGRSIGADTTHLDVDRIVEDVEHLRVEVGASRVSLIGHSFGGLLALEYARRYPQAVEKVILVDIGIDVAAALDHQVRYLAEIAPQRFPHRVDELRALADGTSPPLEKLMQAYQLLGAGQIQRAVLFATDAGMARNTELDEESGLLHAPNALAPAIMASGYLNEHHRNLERKPPFPVLLIAGSRSEVVGDAEIRRTAAILGAKIVWMQNSGHFPYVEEPEKFVRQVSRFLLQ